ncbi:MAG: folylpolyglutamate synthase/dihydrofolate synthase family protein [Opitutaceae bacterium]|jgi:dihydrofolate synthase/folylpolyglutamate synthase
MTGEYQAVQDYLYGLKVSGVKFGIDRMRLVADALGHPERSRPCVHVAGTNGKGSVAAMVESVLRAAGWRTGLYTSPHLVRLGERVQVNRSLLAEEEIISYVGELRPVVERLVASGGPDDRPSFFEFMTAMAFLQFERKHCDVSIIEVGLGGRLDATNVVLPEISVITSISLDHCELLGPTVESIAGEKAGIIKPGRPVVIGRMPAEAVRVIRGIAAERGSPVISVEEEFGSEIGSYPQTSLEGDYQRWNAATAALALRHLGSGWKLTDEVIARGLRQVDWQGRWQRTRLGGRLLILDASHNPEGAQVLDSNLARLRSETGRRPIVITGALGTARAGALLATVARHAGEIHLVVPKQSRACGHEELELLLPSDFRGRVVRSTVESLFPGPGVCTAGGPEDAIVVTGSIYVLGEVLARIEPGRGPEEGRLQDF